MLLLIILILSVTVTPIFGGPITCYWQSGTYSADEDYYHVNDAEGPHAFPVDKCTHLIYAFAKVANKSWTITPAKDDKFANDHQGYEKFTGLKQRNSSLKVLIGIGGGDDRDVGYVFSHMAASLDRRKKFVNSVIDFVNRYNFDGVDMDWEFPADPGYNGRPQDRKNFVELIRDLRGALQPIGKILTSAIPPGFVVNDHNKGYDIPQLFPLLDYLHIMTYNMRGPWDPTIDVHTPLRSRDKNNHYNIKDALGWFDQHGIPKEKLIVGLAFYGHVFYLKDPSKHNPGDPVKPNSPEYDTLDYRETCQKIQNDGWTREYDKIGEAPYAYKGDQWVGYDDVQSLTVKIKFVKEKGYGGVMIWAIDQDDNKGDCGILKALITTVSDQMNKIDD